MRKMIVFGAICCSATILLAQTKKNPDQAPPLKAPALKITPINVKTGLWQSTSTITIVGSLGLPPEALATMTSEQKAKYDAAMQAQSGGRNRTFTHKGCLTQKDLTTDPFAQKDSSDENIHCHGTLLTSTSTDVVLQETCSGEASVTYTMKIHAIDQEHATGTGTGTTTMGGKTMNSNFTFNSTWIGATCPADANQE